MAPKVVPSPMSLSGCAFVLAMVVGLEGGMTLPGWGAALSDDFDAGTPIHGLTNVFGSNVGATAQPGEPAHFGEPAHHSLWAKWTADATSTYTVATTNSTFDTVLAVYLGTELTKLKAIVTNDDVDFRTLGSMVTFRAYAGETFRIAIDGSGDAQGLVELQILPAGGPMPPWTTVDVRGAPFSSDNLTNSVLMVDFWETTCGACVDELYDILQLQSQLAPRGFSMVGLAIDLDRPTVLNFVLEYPYNYPLAMASKSTYTSLSPGVTVGPPTKYLVDQDRNVVGRFLGGLNPVSDTIPFYLGVIEPVLRTSTIVPLQIQREANTVQVSWADSEIGYVLEGSGQAPNGSWIAVNAVRGTNSGRISITVPVDQETRFFRLRSP